METMHPKAQHEHMLAKVDRDRIVQHLSNGSDEEITRIAVTLARQCDLLVHFRRLWTLRVADLDQRLGTEAYMRGIYLNKRDLHKQLFKRAAR